MPKKKSNRSEASAENEKLVQRVDSMMSTELSADAPPKPTVMADEPDDKKTDDQKPAIIIPKNQKTAPELSAKPPIVISLADEAPKDPLEDSATDKAVDDIVAHEGDTVLAVNDALAARKQATAEPGQPSGPRSSHKTFWIILLIILLGTAADAAVFLLRR